MARNVQVINRDRQPLRIGTTKIPPFTTAGTTATTVDLDNPQVQKDLRTFYDRVQIVNDEVSTGTATTAAFSLATQVSHTRTLTISLKTTEGAALGAAVGVDVWFGVSATDPTIVTTAPDSSPAINSSTGTIVDALVTDKYLKVVTSSTGVIKLDVTNSTAASFYVWVRLPNGVVVEETVAIA